MAPLARPTPAAQQAAANTLTCQAKRKWKHDTCRWGRELTGSGPWLFTREKRRGSERSAWSRSRYSLIFSNNSKIRSPAIVIRWVTKMAILMSIWGRGRMIRGTSNKNQAILSACHRSRIRTREALWRRSFQSKGAPSEATAGGTLRNQRRRMWLKTKIYRKAWMFQVNWKVKETTAKTNHKPLKSMAWDSIWKRIRRCLISESTAPKQTWARSWKRMRRIWRSLRRGWGIWRTSTAPPSAW